MSEQKTYKRSIGLIIPGFNDKPAVQTDTYNGKRRAKFSIRDLVRDKIVTVTLWEDVVTKKLPYLAAGSLVVVDGVYSARDKKNASPGADSKMHSISVSRPEGCWVQPSADAIILLDDPDDDEPDFDFDVGGDSDAF